jgi:cephalosporin hydroxylase
VVTLADIHAENPYVGFKTKGHPADVHGWGSDAPIFAELIERLAPRLIIEVGSWKGASAIHMAGVCKRLGLDTTILCVDTWLGAVEFWDDQQDQERYQSLRLRHGYPQVYYTFLANVVRAGHQDTIIPFPQTSQIAARWLARRGVQADMIYIDASHDYDDVLADLHAYWPLVRPHGVLCGDDRLVFTDVDRALGVFTHTVVRQPTGDDRYWQVTK